MWVLLVELLNKVVVQNCCVYVRFAFVSLLQVIDAFALKQCLVPILQLAAPLSHYK